MGSESSNRYSVEDGTVEKSYIVKDDTGIQNAGFINRTSEEQRLIDELNKYSEKQSIACVLLLIVHCHYFYVGRVGRGLLCLFTANFLYIGFVIDLIMIACGKFKDKDNKYVNSPKRLQAEFNLRNYYSMHSTEQ